MQEYGQGLCGPQEQDRVDFGNVYAFVIDIHDKNEPDLTGNQAISGVLTFIIRGFAGQTHGSDTTTVEMPAHEFGMLHGNTES